MATTSNFGFATVQEGDKIDDEVISGNWKKIDTLLKTGAGSGVAADTIDGYNFIVASSLPNTVTNGALCFVYES